MIGLEGRGRNRGAQGPGNSPDMLLVSSNVLPRDTSPFSVDFPLTGREGQIRERESFGLR